MSSIRKMMKESGWSGLSFMAGHISEDPSWELRGQRGAQTFHEMRYSDPTVNAVLMALSLPVREAKWRVNPSSDAPADIEAAEFVEGCLYDMSSSFDDVLTDACSMFAFGWSYLEWVLKRRLGRNPRGSLPASAYDDGRVGFRKMALRKQTSLWEWDMDENGGINGMIQERRDAKPVLIPMSKSLLFRTSKEGNNPEGISVLRPAHRDYIYKKEIERIEGVGIQRAMMGVPIVTLGQGASTVISEGADSHEARANDILAGMHDNRLLGVIEEDDTMTFRFESPDMTGITGDSSRVIQRKDEGIARAALASWLLLGTRERGSYALAKELGDMFFIAVEGFLATISQVFSRWAVPVLFDYNAFPAITGYPEITTSINRRVDLESIAGVVNTMVQNQVIMPDEALEQYMRELAGLPRRVAQIDVGGDPVTPAPDKPQEQKVAGPEVEQAEEQSRRQREAFAVSDKLGSYHVSTDRYQNDLQAIFDDWVQETASSYASQVPEDVSSWYADAWPAASMALLRKLQETAWERIPSAYELGYQSSSVPTDLRSQIDEELRENDMWMSTKLMPAIRDHVRLPDLVEMSYAPTDEKHAAFVALLKGKRSHVGKYSGSFWRAIWVGGLARLLKDGWGGKMRWVTDPIAQHCKTCLLFGDKTYKNLRVLLQFTGGVLPGNGTECDGNCRCHLVRDKGGAWMVV